jgi:hypothetical protein
MTCPRCKGSKRELIKPGLWRCVSPRVLIQEEGGPGLTNPMAGPGVFRHEHKVPCGLEFREAGPGAFLLCACKTVAIGLCAACEEPVCGLHSELCAGRRMCEADNPRLRAKAARTAAAERSAATKKRAWREWQEQVLDELGDAHPIERLVRVMAVWSKDEIWPRRSSQQRELVPTLEVVLGDLWSTDLLRRWPTDLMKSPPWDHEQVLEWFLDAVKTPPTPQQILTPRRVPVLGEMKAKLVTVPGWTFTSGSTSHILADDWHYPMTVLIDGRRGSYLDRPDHAPGNPGFSGVALREMAPLAQLPGLSPPPRV